MSRDGPVYRIKMLMSNHNSIGEPEPDVSSVCVVVFCTYTITYTIKFSEKLIENKFIM